MGADWPGSPAIGFRRWGGLLRSSRLATTWAHTVYPKAPSGSLRRTGSQVNCYCEVADRKYLILLGLDIAPQFHKLTVCVFPWSGVV